MAHHTTERFLDSGKRWSSFGKRWQTGGPFLITFIYILLFFNRKKTKGAGLRQNRKVNSSEQSVNTS
ncbi:hypothetical protein MEW87_002339, partial [Klebsiella pneumoniae]